MRLPMPSTRRSTPLPATARFTAYRLTHEGLPAALVVDSPGLTGADSSMP